MPYKLLSYPMNKTAPRPPAIPEPQVKEFMSIQKDGANVQWVAYYNHTGTHLDTAAHVIENGVSMGGFSAGDFVFQNPSVIRMSLPDRHHITAHDLETFFEDIQDCTMLVICFGVDTIRANDAHRFSNHLPGFTCGAAEWLRRNCPGLRCLGIDLPSFSVISDLENTMYAHNIFLQDNDKKMLIIEEMKLDCFSCCKEGVAKTGISEIIVSPIFIDSVNSGPCTVWARFTKGCII